MSDLVVVGFEDEHTAFEMRAALVKLQKEYLIEMDDVVVVTKDEKGEVKLDELGVAERCGREYLKMYHRTTHSPLLLEETADSLRRQRRG